MAPAAELWEASYRKNLFPKVCFVLALKGEQVVVALSIDYFENLLMVFLDIKTCANLRGFLLAWCWCEKILKASFFGLFLIEPKSLNAEAHR